MTGNVEAPDPAGLGAGRIGSFTVLYDESCPICRAAHRWLAGRAQLVPLHFVAAGSAEARHRFPGLDHRATLRDLTVIADNGEYYVGDAAWVACLWALADHRGTAERISTPRMRPAARRIIAAASAVRQATRSDPRDQHPEGGADYGDECDDACH
jgi:predicted DCC family thiol-disulfide oxidoreductase YuxK